MQPTTSDSTSMVLSILRKSSDLSGFFGEAKLLPPLHEHLRALLLEKGKKNADLIIHACMDDSYLSHILSGTKYPSRDVVLRMAFGLTLNLEETQTLLKVARYAALYPKDDRDAILIFCLEHHKSACDMYELLKQYGHKQIFPSI